MMDRVRERENFKNSLAQVRFVLEKGPFESFLKMLGPSADCAIELQNLPFIQITTHWGGFTMKLMMD